MINFRPLKNMYVPRVAMNGLSFNLPTRSPFKLPASIPIITGRIMLKTGGKPGKITKKFPAVSADRPAICPTDKSKLPLKSAMDSAKTRNPMGIAEYSVKTSVWRLSIPLGFKYANIPKNKNISMREISSKRKSRILSLFIFFTFFPWVKTLSDLQRYPRATSRFPRLWNFSFLFPVLFLHAQSRQTCPPEQKYDECRG